MTGLVLLLEVLEVAIQLVFLRVFFSEFELSV